MNNTRLRKPWLLVVAFYALSSATVVDAESLNLELARQVSSSAHSADGRRECQATLIAARRAAQDVSDWLMEYGEKGDRCKTFLHWSILEEALTNGLAAEPNSLRPVWDRLTGDHPSLRLRRFVVLREELRRYVLCLRALRQEPGRAEFERRRQDLATKLALLQPGPSARQLEPIAAHLVWLRQNQQLPEVVEKIQSSYAHPNLVVSVAGTLLSNAASQEVGEAVRVNDVILGTTFRGQGWSAGRISAEPIPNPRQGVVDLVFVGRLTTSTTGYNGPVQTYNDGMTHLRARTQLVFDADGIRVFPTQATGSSSGSVNGISTRFRGCLDRLTKRIARRRIARDERCVNAIAARRAASQLQERLDSELQVEIDKANQSYAENFRQPLMERDAFPSRFDVSTTSDGLEIVMLQTQAGALGASTAAPPAPLGDLVIRLQESYANNLARATLAGERVLLNDFQQKLEAGESPVLPASHRIGRDDVAMTFASESPVWLELDDGVLTVTFRARAFETRRVRYPAMNVTVAYRLQQTEQGYRLTMEDEPHLVPPDIAAGASRRLSFREIQLEDILKARLTQDLDAIIPLDSFRPSEPIGKVEELVVSHVAVDDAWLSVSLSQATEADPTDDDPEVRNGGM